MNGADAAVWVFLGVGPILLAVASMRSLRAGRVHPRDRAWLIVGAVFSAVALWSLLRP